jgi:hypothetical protein
MNIREFSQYASFANLAYVKWDAGNTGSREEMIKN